MSVEEATSEDGAADIEPIESVERTSDPTPPERDWSGACAASKAEFPAFTAAFAEGVFSSSLQFLRRLYTARQSFGDVDETAQKRMLEVAYGIDRELAGIKAACHE